MPYFIVLQKQEAIFILINFGNLFSLNDYELLKFSGLFNFLILVPLFLVAGYQDRKHHEISSILCVVIYLVLLTNALFFGKSILMLVFILICGFLTLGPIVIDCFGQADFLMIAHFLTSSPNVSTGRSFMLLLGVVWLFCLAIFLIIYKDEDNHKWRPFSGMMVPALPSYSISVLIVAVIRILFLDRFFFAGF